MPPGYTKGGRESEIDMITVVVDVVVDSPKFDELVGLLSNIQKMVKDNEPGVISYHLLQSRDKLCNWWFIETYKNEDSIRIHSEADYFIKSRPKLMACFTKEPVAAIYDIAV